MGLRPTIFDCILCSRIFCCGGLMDEDEIEMMKQWFDSTQGKPVPDADVSRVRAMRSLFEHEPRIPRSVRFIILQQSATDVSHLQLSKNKHYGCSLCLSNVLAEFRFSTSKDSKLHLVLGYKITLLQGRSPVIWQLKSTEERRSIHCLTKSGNQRVQDRRKRIDPLFDDIRFTSYDN
ncbi:hypothetical protein POTOM_025750 [Populus tomentosa]|uniref:Uncharacterized protein n=1 Tax=Populus tomentosa TaxID=118781 RepID=A0A8X7ZFP6_POPTO|nr:hypothetical protein POTOM_025750 [Populus tomentosa]